MFVVWKTTCVHPSFCRMPVVFPRACCKRRTAGSDESEFLKGDMTDTIADMITRLRNGYAAHKTVVSMPHSKQKEAIGRLLEKEQYIEKLEVAGEGVEKALVLSLKYTEKRPVLTGIVRLSKPGLRKYSPANRIPRSLGGYGLTIVSTRMGIMSDKEAKKKGVGGELLCSVW